LDPDPGSPKMQIRIRNPEGMHLQSHLADVLAVRAAGCDPLLSLSGPLDGYSCQQGSFSLCEAFRIQLAARKTRTKL